MSARLLPVLLLGLGGCTLVVQGTMQDVTVTSEPKGATVVAGEQRGVTPVTLKLPKEEQTVLVRMEGYREARVPLTLGVSNWFIGSVAMGVVASVVDIAAGSWKEFDSAAVHVKLEALPGTIEEIPLPVDSEPPGADVLIGGVVYGKTPGEIRVPWPLGEPEKSLTFRLEGYRERSVAVLRSDLKVAKVVLEGLAVPVVTTLGSNPAGAEVRIDGRRVGQTPLTLTLQWGPKDRPRAVEVALPGYHPEKRTLGPRQAELAVALREVVEEKPLKIAVEPKGAKVVVDGKPAGEAPLTVKLSWSVSQRKHTVTASLPGYATKTVEVGRADADKPLEIRLQPSIP